VINPYTLIAIAGAWAVSLAGASYWAYGAGQDKEIATQARESKASVQAAEIAARVSAEAISKIEVRNVHVRQALEREVITRELAQAHLDRLEAEGAVEYATAVMEYNEKRIARLNERMKEYK